MLQSTSEYEERRFDDIQRALDIEHTVKALEAQLCYDQHSPEEVARQILKAACKFYDADWCGLIQVDLDLKIWTPFWWYNDSSEDKTAILTEEFESAEFLDRWVQAVRHGKPMIVPDAEEVKNTYPAEYNLYQRLGIAAFHTVVEQGESRFSEGGEFFHGFTEDISRRGVRRYSF